MKKMMTDTILEINGLCKKYPGFLLDNVSFSLRRGRIMGLIGRNGAGKTTTLKSIFNLVHPDRGEIRIFGLTMPENEREIKSRIGYAAGSADCYKRKKIRDIVSVTKSFYESWDDDAYRKYLRAFDIDEGKTPVQLSQGMQVKLSLTVAMSHHAELLILDEPTSGLDPVSRAELLDALLFLKDKGVSILYSTHITSDLEKCADEITYIVRGKLVASDSIGNFVSLNNKAGRGNTIEDIMISYEKESLYEKIAD